MFPNLNQGNARRLISTPNEQLSNEAIIEISLSNGCLIRFKVRNGSKSFCSHEEDGDAIESAIAREVPILHAHLSIYAFNGIFNDCEFDLFCRAALLTSIGPARLQERK